MRPAVINAMSPMLADMPSTYAAAVTKDLLVKVKRLNLLEDKVKNLVGINDYPRAVAPVLEYVKKVACMPAPGSARVALELLMAVPQGSVPEWENEWSSEKERVRFDAAVDELYMALAGRLKEEEGKGFKVKAALEDLRSFAKNMEAFEISSCFKQS